MNNRLIRKLTVAVILYALIFYVNIFAEVEIPDQKVEQESLAPEETATPAANKPLVSVEAPEIKTAAKPVVDSKIEEKPGVLHKSSADARQSNVASVTDRIIGSTFKTLAKAFISTIDIEKLKKGNIDKLNKKDEAKFRKQYAKAYKVLRECLEITERYGLKEDLTKQEAIEKIRRIGKKDMLGVLNSIPDTFIAGQFSAYLKEKKQEMEKSNLVAQINHLWAKITVDAFGNKDSKKK